MRGHLHTGLVEVLFVTVAAAVGFNVIRLGAGWLANHGSPAIGDAIGGFFTFGGK